MVMTYTLAKGLARSQHCSHNRIEFGIAFQFVVSSFCAFASDHSRRGRVQLPPELYVTPCVLTLHALGCPLQQAWDVCSFMDLCAFVRVRMAPNVQTMFSHATTQLLCLWDYYLRDGDPLLHLFVSLAWITSFRRVDRQAWVNKMAGVRDRVRQRVR